MKAFSAVLTGLLLFGLLSQHKCVRYKNFPAETIPGSTTISEGNWKFNMQLGKEVLPFFCQYRSTDSSFTIINATEKIVCKPVVFKNDSVFFSTPVFQNIFKLKINSNYSMSGSWYNLSKSKDYIIPVQAFITNEKPSIERLPKNAGEKWEVVFGTNGETYKSIGLFNYFESDISYSNETTTPVSGTFLTETGDYRFLEGKKVGIYFVLSCFDGSHAFLFTAKYNQTYDTLRGMFYSGTHHSEPWTAWKNDKARLRNPDSITVLKPGEKSIAFSFPDLNGGMVSFPSKRFENKVTVISIMGSWCPNCMDETLFMQQLKNKYGSKGLEIVALCFERTNDYARSVEAVKKMKSNLNADFEFLIAGASGKDAYKALPQLTAINSYPTTFFIDKQGVVRKIYTGFYGPSTGLYYNHYTEQTENFIQKLMME